MKEKPKEMPYKSIRIPINNYGEYDYKWLAHEPPVELNCPVCNDVQYLPMVICLNNHSICQSCLWQKRFHTCTLCHEAYITSPYPDQKLCEKINKLHIKCGHVNCDTTIQVGYLQEHNKEYHSYFCTTNGCDYNTVNYQDIIIHNSVCCVDVKNLEMKETGCQQNQQEYQQEENPFELFVQYPQNGIAWKVDLQNWLHDTKNNVVYIQSPTFYVHVHSTKGLYYFNLTQTFEQVSRQCATLKLCQQQKKNDNDVDISNDTNYGLEIYIPRQKYFIFYITFCFEYFMELDNI